MFRVSVSDDAGASGADWSVVLSGNLTHRWNDTEPRPLPIEQLELEVAAVEKQFVKFEVLSHYGRGGGLEYFDIVRTRLVHLDVEECSEELLAPAVLYHKEPARASKASYMG